MISLEVRVVDQELLVNLEHLPEKLHAAVADKLRLEVSALHLKVAENLSGKVLNTKSGNLLDALDSGVEQIGDLLIGYVTIVPENAKVYAYAMAHEYGGKGSYEIVPIHKLILRFQSKSGEIVFAPYVYHPPAIERSYLRSALHEMSPQIEEGLNQAVQDALLQ